MAKQSAPIQEVSRLLDLVPYLSTHSHISLKELAREFDIDEKSMANDLTALSMCGLPGYTPYELIEIFFDSGFVTINNHDALDIPRALTSVEAASLLIGLEILRDSSSIEDVEVVKKIDNLLSQLKSLLGGTIEVEDDPATAHLAIIQSAIASRHSLEIDYLSPLRDVISIRKIQPLSLKVENGFTYLVAYPHSHNSIRNFRLDRVIAAREVLDVTEKPSGEIKNSDEALTLSLKVLGSRRTISELFNIGVIPTSGEIDVKVFSPEWAVKALIAHSPDIELLNPVDLRQKVRGDLGNILALYAP